MDPSVDTLSHHANQQPYSYSALKKQKITLWQYTQHDIFLKPRHQNFDKLINKNAEFYQHSNVGSWIF